MGRASKRKGNRAEREIVGKLRQKGFEAHRVPLSGPSDAFPGDVLISLDGRKLIGEVKRRKNGFKQLYKWLEGKDILFLRADRKEWLVVMKLENWEVKSC